MSETHLNTNFAAVVGVAARPGNLAPLPASGRGLAAASYNSPDELSMSVQRFYLYAERGLVHTRVSVWLYDERLQVAHQETLLACYTYHCDRRARRLRAVSDPQFSHTPYASPQLDLWELDDDQWRTIMRVRMNVACGRATTTATSACGSSHPPYLCRRRSLYCLRDSRAPTSSTCHSDVVLEPSVMYTRERRCQKFRSNYALTVVPA